MPGPSAIFLLSLIVSVRGNSWNFSQTPFTGKLLGDAIIQGAPLQLHQFDECKQIPNSQYCVVDVYITPITDKNSEKVWNRLQEQPSNADQHYVKHVLWGVCFPAESSVHDFHSTLQQTLNNSQELELQINISLSSENCQQTATSNLDPIGQTVCALLILLILVIAAGTATHSLSNKTHTTKPGMQMLLCFSLVQNWNRLLSRNEKDKLYCIHGMRFLTMVFILLAHRILAVQSGSIQNPQFLEQWYKNPLWIIIVNGHVIVATFFLLSGFLLAYVFLSEINTNYFKKHTFTNIGLIYIYRYTRLTPSYAVVLAVTATLLKNMGSGPLWSHNIGIEETNCRNVWWTNMLYINNYVNAESPCMLHTWYLAADTQLFVVTVLLLVIICHWPHYARIVLGLCLGLAVLIPILQTYIMKLDPTLLLLPEKMKDLMVNKTYLNSYIPGHTNAGPYMVGCFLGYNFYNTQQKPVSKQLVTIWWLTLLVLPLATLGSLYWCYLSLENPSQWVSALYAGLYKPIFAIGIGCLLLACIRGHGWLANLVLSWKPFLVLGRLTYCAYLVHFNLQKASVGALTYSLYVTEYSVIKMAASDVVQSYALALILCLCVEMPTSALCKLFIPQKEENLKPCLKEPLSENPNMNSDKSTYSTDNTAIYISHL